MTKEQLRNAIDATGGKFFSLEAVKKDGTPLVINGHKAPEGTIVGGGSTLTNTVFEPVWDRNRRRFCAVNPATIKSFSCGVIGA